MKGFELNILSSFLILILLIFLSFLIGSTSSFYKNVDDLIIKRENYVLSNALDYGKVAASEAFLYSFYQGCWDVLQRGGYSTIPQDRLYERGGMRYALWYDNGDVSPSLERFLGELGTETASVMKFYTSAPYAYILGTQVSLPLDYGVTFSKTEGGLMGKASSLSFIFVEKKDEKQGVTIRLEKDPSLQRVFVSSCGEIFDTFMQEGKFLGDDMENIAFSEINKWEKIGEAVAPEGTPVSAWGDVVFSSIYKKNIAQAEQDIQTSLLQQLQAIVFSSSIFTAKAEPLETIVDILPSCQAIGTVQEGVKISCTFSYKVTAAQKFSLSDHREERNVPVSTGESVALSPFTLDAVVRMERTIDSFVAPLDVSGTYSLSLNSQSPSLSSTTHRLILTQQGRAVESSIDDTGGIQGELRGRTLTLHDATLTLQGNLAHIDLSGTIADGIEGSAFGTILINGKEEPYRGTFRAEPLRV